MSIFLAVVLTVSGDPSTSATAAPAPSVKAATPAPLAPPVRSGRELADAAHAALRKWAKAGDKDAGAAAKDLLTIYCELQQDTRLARSTRETLRTTVRARLDQLSTQICKRIAKENAAKTVAVKADSQVKSVAATDKPRPLAQVGVPAGGGGGGLGGPGGAQQNAAADNGQALVDLIQNTISPKSWDANGGDCTIYYWQQQHAIVVRATGDVHGEISDALEQLERASR
jgi:hypothetical protein